MTYPTFHGLNTTDFGLPSTDVYRVTQPSTVGTIGGRGVAAVVANADGIFVGAQPERPDIAHLVAKLHGDGDLARLAADGGSARTIKEFPNEGITVKPGQLAVVVVEPSGCGSVLSVGSGVETAMVNNGDHNQCYTPEQAPPLPAWQHSPAEYGSAPQGRGYGNPAVDAAARALGVPHGLPQTLRPFYDSTGD